jgi:membrane protein implicated in regulation of membrane protease activity
MEILWWHWLVLGLVLAAAEMASAGGFYIIFFGIGAMAVGILSAAGLAGPVWMQTFLFSAISIGSLALFRSRLLKMMQPDPQAPTVDALVGEVAIATEDVGAGGIGKVELRGSSWSARNDAAVVVTRGTRCRVTSVDGLMLHVVPEGAR